MTFWGQGYNMIYPTEEDSSNDDMSLRQRICFGHGGLGGSIALCDACSTTGDVVSIAITTNRLVFDSEPTRELIRVVYKDVLKMQAPLQFADNIENKESINVQKQTKMRMEVQ